MRSTGTLTRAEAGAILAAMLADKGVSTAELPEGAPREALIDTLCAGRYVDVYRRPSGTLVLAIQQRSMHYESRWHPRAWCAYVAGEHPTDVYAQCMCEPCQEARQEAARAQLAMREAMREEEGTASADRDATDSEGK